MQSLRARLIAGLVAVAAVGLVALAAVTYFEQRSFLLDRLDQQLTLAIPAVERVLRAQGVDLPGGSGRGGPFGRGGGTVDRPAPGADRRPGIVNLPPGTYGVRLDGDGAVLGEAALTFASEAPPKPDLPANLRPGAPTTVAAVGSDLDYRVLAVSDGSGTTVAAVPLGETAETLDRLLLVEILVILAVLLAIAGLAWWIVRLGLRPLDRIGDTAGAIAGGDLSHRVSPADERTEVGRLGLALNRMLTRLEDAFAERRASEDRLRTFLADASHELRTPLVSIRGYAELFRLGAAADPAELEKAMRRIEDEAARMGVLVEDMLTLARLDEVQTAEREDIDLTEIARDAVSDAVVSAPEREITLLADAPVIVHGDRNGLRQVLGNLVGNALAHTPAGTPIEVSVALVEESAPDCGARPRARAAGR